MSNDTWATPQPVFEAHPYLEDLEISRCGLIRNMYTKRPYKTSLMANGYMRIVRRVKGKSKTFLVHRLVAETFLLNVKKSPVVNHINGVKNDNRAENLEWVSYAENNIHAHKLGLNFVSESNREKSRNRAKSVWKHFRERKANGENPNRRTAFKDYQNHTNGVLEQVA